MLGDLSAGFSFLFRKPVQQKKQTAMITITRRKSDSFICPAYGVQQKSRSEAEIRGTNVAFCGINVVDQEAAKETE
jgi:hypothetical protein